MKEVSPEKLKLIERTVSEWFPEKEKPFRKEEKRELSADKEELAELRKKIAQMKVEPKEEKEVEKEAEKMKRLSVKEKVKKILVLAATKNLAFAIKTAQKLDDPLVLDLVHDILAKDRYYRNFL